LKIAVVILVAFLWYVSAWAMSLSRTPAFLSDRRLVIGSGRSSRTYRLNEVEVIALHRSEGFSYLVLITDRTEVGRAYMDPDTEKQILPILERSGRLQIA
jgi:hypothetical protein